MHSVQSVSKPIILTKRHRRRCNIAAAAAVAAKATAEASSSSAIVYKLTTAYDNRVPKGVKIVHGIVVSNLSLVLLQKEYIEQFYFEKRSGGGGPDPDANADLYRHLNKANNEFRSLHFG